MNMKRRVIRLGLPAAFILAAGLCFFSWPHMVQAEYGETDVWGYSQWWNSDYNSLWADYTPWPSPLTSYSSQWPGYEPASNQSLITYGQGDSIFGLLPQGLPVYIPPQVPFFENLYGHPGSPEAYLPFSQWPRYSYAMPLTPFGYYINVDWRGNISVGLVPISVEESYEIYVRDFKEAGYTWDPEPPPWESWYIVRLDQPEFHYESLSGSLFR